jgi:hypothetical protein
MDQQDRGLACLNLHGGDIFPIINPIPVTTLLHVTPIEGSCYSHPKEIVYLILCNYSATKALIPIVDFQFSIVYVLVPCFRVPDSVLGIRKPAPFRVGTGVAT